MEARSSKFETLKRVGPTVGVILSLLLVAYEVRQNTKATRGGTLQAISEQSMQMSLSAIESPELRVAWQRAARGLQYATPADVSILSWWYAAAIRVVENRYRQVQLGLVDSAALGQLGGFSAPYRHPFFAYYWANVRDQHAADFAKWVNDQLLSLSQDSLPTRAPLPEVLESWTRTDSARSASPKSKQF